MALLGAISTDAQLNMATDFTGVRAVANNGTGRAIAVPHGEFYRADNTGPSTISSADKQHAVRLTGMSSGNLSSWTQDQGTSSPIVGTSDNGGTLRLATSAHNFVTGDIVTVVGLATAAQNDVTAVTVVDGSTLDCDDITFASAAETGVVIQGSHLIAGSGAAGDYQVTFRLSSASASANRTFRFSLFVNKTEQTNLLNENHFSATDIQSSTSTGVITVAESDVVWLAAENVGQSSNITIKHINCNLHLI